MSNGLRGDVLKFLDRKHLSVFSILLGVFFLVEHVFTYGYVELLDFWGHEWLGLGFVVFGFLVVAKKGSLSEELVSVFDKLFKKE